MSRPLRASRLMSALACLATASVSYAQLGLQNVLQRTPQSVLTNPAVLLDDRLTVQLASYGVSTQLSFSPADLGSVSDGALFLSPEAIERTIVAEASARLELDASTLVVNMRRPWGQLGFHHGVRAFADAVFPQAALMLIAEGNRVTIGASRSVLPEGYLSTWHELGFHYARQFGSGLRVGGRVKLLLGASDLRLSGGQRGRLEVSPADYAIAYDVAAEGFTAGYDIDLAADSLALSSLAFAPGGGYGAALDLGLAFAPSEAFEYGLSVRDLGGIRWTRGRRHGAMGGGVYRGAEGDVFAEGYSLTAVAGYDSVRQRLGLLSEDDAYASRLPAKLTAHARYTLSERVDLGAVAMAVLTPGRSGFNVALRGGYRVARELRVGLVAGGGREGVFVGGSVEARLGSVLLFASSDQVLGLFDAYRPRSTHGRLGVAWVRE